MSMVKNFHFDILAMLAGMLLPFGFAPFELSIIGIIAPLLLLLATNVVSGKLAIRRGFFFGLGFFAIGVSWVYISVHVFGDAPLPLSLLITTLFIGFLSLFFAAQCYCLNKIWPQESAFKFMLAFPTVWVIFELLRTWIFSGFPWLLLGYTQTNTWLKGFAPLIGVYGISFIVASLTGLCFYVLRKKYFRWHHAGFVGMILISGWAFSEIHWTTPYSHPIVTTLIQGNIPQTLKWQPEQLEKTIELYMKHTADNWSSELIIWPEAAITTPYNSAREFLTELSNRAAMRKTTIITGIPVVQSHTAFNSMVAIGNGTGLYHKRHLVPFGEYTPLKSILNPLLGALHIPMSDFTAGNQKQATLSARDISIAPYICYEIAYPLECLTFLPRAHVLLTITDDSWFGHSFASAQHLQMAQMRSLETGRFLLFTSNTGITAIINPEGRIIKALPTFQEAVLTAAIQPMTGSTPWIILKLYPLLGLMLMVLLYGLFQRFPVILNTAKDLAR